MKKAVKVLMGIAAALVITAGASFAAPDDWATCTPASIGPAGTVVRMNVVDCNIAVASSDGYVTLSSVGTDQMMAAILTAMSLNKPVAIHINAAGDMDGSYPIVDSVIFTNI